MKKLTGTFVVVAVAIVTAIVHAQSQPAFPAITINYQDFSVDEKGVETPGTRLLARIKSDGSRSTQNFDRDRITPTFREVLDLLERFLVRP